MTAAKVRGAPLILVHESDTKKHGASLATHREACPDVLSEYMFGGCGRPVIPWHRVYDFQLVSLKQVAECVLRACPAATAEAEAEADVAIYLPGEISRRTAAFASPVTMWVSEANEGVASADGSRVAFAAL